MISQLTLTYSTDRRFSGWHTLSPESKNRPQSRPRRAGNFHINALKRAGPPRRASKSKLRTHDKGCLDQHFLDNFHFTSSVCLCVGYKMKTCAQISDSEFRPKINVVNPGDSAKRASPGRRAGFSHVNARWNPALLVKFSPASSM